MPTPCRPGTILIAGSTAIALLLGDTLQRGGRCVAVVDRKRPDASTHADLLAAWIEGDPCDPSALRRARAEEAVAMISATQSDTATVAAAIIGRRFFRIERVVAVVHDPERAELLGDHGVEVLCATSLIAGDVLSSLGIADPRHSRSQP